ncbi:MAG: transcription termination/antitermination protein NusG, partial [Chloroflexi bacterium]|nr:transcription termination/antitermination protein NusG [Chloroflexota bacterium]
MARRKKSAETVLKDNPPEDTSKLQAEAAEESEQGPVITDEEMFRPGRAWYVIHTYSGYEDKACTNLEQRIKSMDAEDLIHHVVVPSVNE